MIRYIYHHSGGMRRIRIQDINRMAPKPLRSHYRNLSPKVEATKRQENLASIRRKSPCSRNRNRWWSTTVTCQSFSVTTSGVDWKNSRTFRYCWNRRPDSLQLSFENNRADNLRTRAPRYWLAVLRCKYWNKCFSDNHTNYRLDTSGQSCGFLPMVDMIAMYSNCIFVVVRNFNFRHMNSFDSSELCARLADQIGSTQLTVST